MSKSGAIDAAASLQHALSLLHEAGTIDEDARPPLVKTAQEWSVAMNSSEYVTRKRLRAAVKAGTFRQQTYRLRRADGKVYPVECYEPVK